MRYGLHCFEIVLRHVVGTARLQGRRYGKTDKGRVQSSDLPKRVGQSSRAPCLCLPPAGDMLPLESGEGCHVGRLNRGQRYRPLCDCDWATPRGECEVHMVRRLGCLADRASLVTRFAFISCAACQHAPFRDPNTGCNQPEPTCCNPFLCKTQRPFKGT